MNILISWVVFWAVVAWCYFLNSPNGMETSDWFLAAFAGTLTIVDLTGKDILSAIK